MLRAAAVCAVLLGSGCTAPDVSKDDDTDASGDSLPDTSGDTGVGDTDPRCGNAVVEGDEACDEGDENGSDRNCLPDCTWNPQQAYVASASALLGQRPADARGVEDPTAPAGTGAWGTSATDLDQSGLVKFELYFDPTFEGFAFFGDITLADLASISYHTRKPGPADAADFYLVLYTRADGVDDEGAFYGYRLTALPSQARALDAPADSWNTWSTADGPNQLVFADQPVLGTFTAPGLPSLGELTGDAPFDWSSVVTGAPATAIRYGLETIRFISLQTSSGTQTSEFEGLVDLVEIVLVDGRRLTVDLEP